MINSAPQSKSQSKQYSDQPQLPVVERVTPTALRKDIYNYLDRIASGELRLLIERGGNEFHLVPKPTVNKSEVSPAVEDDFFAGKVGLPGLVPEGTDIEDALETKFLEWSEGDLYGS